MTAYLIRGGLVVGENRTAVLDILTDGETITAIAPRLEEAAAELVDATGLIVLPGGIDVHTHLDLPFGRISSCDDFMSGTRAALFGGTTCIVDFATQFKGQSLASALGAWHDKADGKALCDYGFHLAVTDYPRVTDDELAAMITHEGVTSFKAYMAYKNIMLDPPSLAGLLARLNAHRGLLMVHAEDGPAMDLIAAKLRAEGKLAPRYHAASHPVAAEAAAVQEVVELAGRLAAPIYIVHVTAAAALREINRAQKTAAGRGKVIAECCVQHLLLHEDLYDRDDPAVARYVLSPPFRSPVDSGALWQGLADGAIAVLATDHCPFTLAQKALGARDFAKVPNGVAPLEHRLELAYHYGVQRQLLTLEQWMRVCSLAPAKLMGLYPRKGTLAPGADADIVLFDPRSPRTIRAVDHHTRCDYSLFEGWFVSGSCRTVFVRGTKVMDQGGCLVQPGFGRFVKRGLSSAFCSASE